MTSQFTIDTVPPAPVSPGTLTVGPVTNGQVTISGAPGSVEPGARVRLTNTRTGQAVLVAATTGGSFAATLMVQSGDVVSITSTDTAGNSSAPLSVTTGVPPDPATVAPPVEPGVATTVAAATAFLYTGTNPIQTGVAPGTIELQRAAVVRGKVLGNTNAPLPGVTISILNHPEFGQTRSRADGMFDLAVNGGGLLVIQYEHAGLLPAQRQVSVPWQDYVVLADVMHAPARPPGDDRGARGQCASPGSAG